MKPTKYFSQKSAMTDFAKAFRAEAPLNWYVRTTLECNHRVVEKRKAIILMNEEKAVQRLVCCGICKKSYEPKTETL